MPRSAKQAPGRQCESIAPFGNPLSFRAREMYFTNRETNETYFTTLETYFRKGRFRETNEIYFICFTSFHDVKIQNTFHLNNLRKSLV